ncbi:hypothetical protein GCM10011326_18880 [Salipiger profundus]|jgi:hypothetical protein|uniref:Uncharacterized protein n=1 Tax=Salipiger profundus TaxID=1229727 RepID=A0A1U7D1P9_9RHOB|nr:hypothetical protein Ga0080559_TMP1275 [Salipiger profundus]GGA07340.1 hypothetical protein GCM10011326_18880 [Salipiger profundus]SFC43614.1 hypothetical protein SAMN05444415_103257 [Salipiger profundus]
MMDPMNALLLTLVTALAMVALLSLPDDSPVAAPVLAAQR